MRIRPPGADELDAFFDVIGLAFGAPMKPDERETDRAILDPARALVAEEDGRIVGTAAALGLQLAVPGAAAPVAGVTSVSVSPDRRRRGVLSALMRRQLADLHAGGAEPIAALFASEAAIYGRFGYGMAARSLDVTVTGHPGFAAAPPSRGGGAADLRVVPAREALADLGETYERCWRSRPGCFARTDAWWRLLTSDEPVPGRRSSPLLAALVDAGYALYRTEPRWEEGRPVGRVEVVEVFAAHPAAEAALWRHLTGLDLMASLHARLLPPDSPLPQLLADPRAARALVNDNLWVRLVDVPRALAARRYATPLDLVLEVSDPGCPWNEGRFALRVDPQEAVCERTDGPADLALDVAALGAAYLGGTTLLELAGAGRVAERRAGTLVAASVAFRGLREPWCPTIF